MTQTFDDEFELYDLRVEVLDAGTPFVSHARPARLAADTGGTFTDVVLELDDGDRAEIAALADTAPGPRGDCYELEREAGGPHSAIMWKNQNLRGAPREAAYADAPPGYDPGRSGVR